MSDTISRQEAIEALGEEPEVWNGTDEEIAARNQWRADVDAIKAVPSAEPKKGKWIEPTPEGCFTHDAKAYSECSECGKKEFLGWRKNFCPNCGADNREDEP